jgi:hypothetical protein
MELQKSEQKSIGNSTRKSSSQSEISIYEFFGTKISELTTDIKDLRNYIHKSLASNFNWNANQTYDFIEMAKEDEWTIEKIYASVEFAKKTIYKKDLTIADLMSPDLKFNKKVFRNGDLFRDYCFKSGRPPTDFIQAKAPNGKLIWWDKNNGELPPMFQEIKKEKPIENNQNIIPITDCKETISEIIKRMQRNLAEVADIEPRSSKEIIDSLTKRI